MIRYDKLVRDSIPNMKASHRIDSFGGQGGTT